MIQQSAEVEVADLEGNKFGAAAREDDVNHELGKFERGDFGDNVAGIADAVASDFDASASSTGFFGRTLQTTLVCVISLWRLVGMAS